MTEQASAARAAANPGLRFSKFKRLVAVARTRGCANENDMRTKKKLTPPVKGKAGQPSLLASSSTWKLRPSMRSMCHRKARAIKCTTTPFMTCFGVWRMAQYPSAWYSALTCKRAITNGGGGGEGRGGGMGGGKGELKITESVKKGMDSGIFLHVTTEQPHALSLFLQVAAHWVRKKAKHTYRTHSSRLVGESPWSTSREKGVRIRSI